MQEETIFNLYQNSIADQKVDSNRNTQQSIKDNKINLLKEPHFRAPSKGKTAAEFYHLISQNVLCSTFTIPKRDHGSFGLPRKAYKVELNDENKIISNIKRRMESEETAQLQNTYTLKTHKLPPVPKFNEGPIQGLKSDFNFINANRQRATSLRPQSKLKSTDYLAKKNYGVAPGYLDRVKNVITQEKEYINMITQAQKPKEPSKVKLEQDEVEKLRKALKKRYDEVNREYQSITHISKVYSQGVKRKKEACEKELKLIERDLAVMGKETIVVDESL